METIEIKTPLLKPKKYRQRKRTVEEFKVEEFNSFGSSNYFKQYDDSESEDNECGKKSRVQTERTIEDYLTKKHIFTTPVSIKKDQFFAESRERVNSISYFEALGDSDSTDISPRNQSKKMSQPRLDLTPINSKISQSRSKFISMGSIRMSPIAALDVQYRNGSKFSNTKINLALSDHDFKEVQEENEEFFNLTTSCNKESCPKHFSGL
jgi:hypothetical protein